MCPALHFPAPKGIYLKSMLEPRSYFNALGWGDATVCFRPIASSHRTVTEVQSHASEPQATISDVDEPGLSE